MGKLLTLTMAAIVALAGCGGVNYPEHSLLVDYRKFEKVVKDPSEGQVATTQVGESMIAAFNVASLPAITLTDAIELRTKYNDKWQQVVIVPAGTHALAGEDSQYRFFAATAGVRLQLINEKSREDEETQRGGLAIGPTGKVAVYWYRDKDHLKALSAPVSGVKFSDAKVDLPPRVQSFRRELVYGGISGTTVSVSYREFADTMARPAFTQDLKYDLSMSPIIGYKSARFEVLKAENSTIRFRVLKQLDCKRLAIPSCAIDACKVEASATPRRHAAGVGSRPARFFHPSPAALPSDG